MVQFRNKVAKFTNLEQGHSPDTIQNTNFVIILSEQTGKNKIVES